MDTLIQAFKNAACNNIREILTDKRNREMSGELYKLIRKRGEALNKANRQINQKTTKNRKHKNNSRKH